jgi:hypothetical protein
MMEDFLKSALKKKTQISSKHSGIQLGMPRMRRCAAKIKTNGLAYATTKPPAMQLHTQMRGRLWLVGVFSTYTKCSRGFDGVAYSASVSKDCSKNPVEDRFVIVDTRIQVANDRSFLF